ncbi:nucleolar protein 6 [Hyperolius riggenbachi]|uniref:nucleolar protein 6 n=1 Tax=Hyperolius riggenbachi TaxID=752182 RepID=UPI0035A32383
MSSSFDHWWRRILSLPRSAEHPLGSSTVRTSRDIKTRLNEHKSNIRHPEACKKKKDEEKKREYPLARHFTEFNHGVSHLRWQKKISVAKEPSEDVGQTKPPPAAKQKGKSAVKRPSKTNNPKPAKMKKSNLGKPMTTEELIRMKEAEQLYHTSLLRMQIEELLQEVKLKEKRRKNIDDFLKKISDIIEKIPESSEADLVDQTWLPKTVKVPFLQTPYQVKGKFRYRPPASIKVVGSYLLGTCIKPEINVDLAVTMPQEVLQEKDNVNQRYLRKRALYLAHMANHLSKSNTFGSMKFAYMNSNHMKPVLLLRPQGKDEKVVTVRIHICLPPGYFKPSRFYPSKNNIRTDWYQGERTAQEEGTANPPTPHYNNAVLWDSAVEQHFHHLSACATDFPGMKDGICILKVWLRQRQLDKGYGCFNGFLASMLVAYLLSKNKITRAMSGHQVLRNVLQFLANTDLTVNGITMFRSTDSSLPSIEDYHQAFEVVFVDPLGVINLCADMTAAKYRQVQFEAKESLKHLDDTTSNGFLLLLMVPKPFIRTFDHVFHIKHVTKLQSTCKKMNLHNELLDRCGDYVSTALPFILPLVKRGLDQRLILVSHSLLQRPEWDITEEPAEHQDVDSVSVGLLLTPEFYTSALEKGPAADSTEAVDFQKFWGPKSELRRFQDASICEAVVWPVNSVQEKRRIPELIVKHLLQLHADLPEAAIGYTGNMLDCTLTRGKKPGTGEEQMASIIQSYDDLSRKIWNLEDLPLTVTSVQGTHPSLRYTDVFPPLIVKPDWSFFKTVFDKKALVPLAEKPSPAYVSPMKVICHMEGSGKWPQDKDAIKRVKAAFQIKLAELLKEQHDLLCKVSPTYTDVYKDSFVFRLQVAYHREPQLMKEYLSPEGMLKSRETEESQQLELETIHLTHLTSTLHGLHQQLPAFGGTSRLAKRWISAQLLANSISEECVDLLVAHLFLHPAPFTTPSSPQVGFLRFLNLLASFDWKNCPLIVNLNNDLTDEEIKGIQDEFSAGRSQLPVMFIATPKDRKLSVWTKKQPTAQILQRLIVLAAESLPTLEKQLMEPSDNTDIKVVFRPPLDLYDVLIYLHPKHIPRHREAVDQPAKSFVRGLLREEAAVKALRFPVVDYDPTQLYLQDLRASYGEFALFFYDKHGGDMIAVLWNPTSFTPQSVKATNIKGRMADKGSNNVLLVPDVTAIVEGFKVLGEGLVERVEARTEKWKI